MLIKSDFHIHTGDDPYDFLPHSNFETIDWAAKKGLNCIAISNHDKYSWTETLSDYAAQKGVLLIPSIEAQMLGKDLLILNADKESEKLKTEKDFYDYKTAERFFIAPHPFYPIKYSFNETIEKHLDLFDAIEYSSCYLRWFNKYNKKAEKFAEEKRLPIVCNSDAHSLWQLGTVWTEIEAEEFNIQSVFKAIREKKTKIVHKPMSNFGFFRFFVLGGNYRAAKRLLNGQKKDR